jgi:hypothetical protein
LRYCVSGAFAAKDLFGDCHGGHCLGPAGVEGEVGDGLDQLGLGRPVVFGQSEVEDELVGVAVGDEGRDGDEAAVAGREVGAFPYVAE